MKILKFMFSMALIFSMQMIFSQEVQNLTGVMDATTMNTFSYKKDGVQYPYKVIVRENRAYKKSFKEDSTQQSRITHKQMTQVAKLITISNEHDPIDNRVVSLRYDKRINDSFEIVTNEKGFSILVGDRKIDYIMGKGISFPKVEDENFFIIAEYDLMQ